MHDWVSDTAYFDLFRAAPFAAADQRSTAVPAIAVPIRYMRDC